MLTLRDRSSLTQLYMSTTPSLSAISSMMSITMKHPVLPAPALSKRRVQLMFSSLLENVKCQGSSWRYLTRGITAEIKPCIQAFAGFQNQFYPFFCTLGVKLLWVEWLQQPVWGSHSTGEAEVCSEFTGQHNEGISALPTCSEQPEVRRLEGSWIWPAVQIPAGLLHGMVHRGLASQWNEIAEFLESHEHLSVEKIRVEKQVGMCNKLDKRRHENVTFKAWALLRNIHPPPIPISVQDCWRAFC